MKILRKILNKETWFGYDPNFSDLANGEIT